MDKYAQWLLIKVYRFDRDKSTVGPVAPRRSKTSPFICSLRINLGAFVVQRNLR